MRCQRCHGSLEPIRRLGQPAFLFCRPCKLPHNAEGQATITSAELRSGFNPLKIARDTIASAHPDMTGVGKTALEVALIQGLQECYFAGLRDGVLLAYSQDYQDGKPYEATSEPVQGPTDHSGKG